MSLGHLSILLTRYGAFYMYVYWGHGVGTKSQLTQTVEHITWNTSQGLVAAVNSCFVHMRRAVAGTYWRRAAGTTSNCAPTFTTAAIAWPGTRSRIKSCFIHRHFNMELTAGTKRIYVHTLSTAVIACPRDMYLQGVAVSEFLVSHNFMSLQSVLPKFIWSNFMWNVAAMNVEKSTAFIVWTAPERASGTLLQIEPITDCKERVIQCFHADILAINTQSQVC